MTKKTQKPEGKATEAVAVELEEQDLEGVQGGIAFLLPAVQKVIPDGTSRIADGSVRIAGAGKTVLGDGSV